MTESAQPTEPDGTEEASRAEVGEPSRIDERAGAGPNDEARPDLDAREERMSTTRKPAGPSREEPEERDDVPPRQNDQGPTDPSGAEAS